MKNKLSRKWLIAAHIVLTPILFIGGFVSLFLLMILFLGILIEKYGDFGYSIMLIISFVTMLFAMFSYFTGLVIYYKRKRFKREKKDKLTLAK